MKHKSIYLIPALALSLTLLPGALPAQSKQEAAATGCAGLIVPLQREIKKAQPYLQRIPGGHSAHASRSRMLSDLLQDADFEAAVARTLSCLMSNSRPQ